MSSTIGSVQISLEAVDNVSGVMDQVKGSISGLSGIATTLGQNMGSIGRIVGDLGGPFEGLGGIISGFATGGPAGAGIAMIGTAVDFLKDSVDAASESERVMAILKQTVENQGTAWDTVKGGIDKTLQSMQATTRFSDEELAQALGTLVQHGMDVEGAMKALQTAMDTATGSGKPLQEVAAAIGKAYEGQDTALTRLVPAIGDLSKNMGEGATQGQAFQGALDLLNQRFGGQALTDAQTFAGVQERMANAWNDFQETVGKAVLPALTDLLNGFMKIGTEAIGPLMDSLGELWKALFGEDVDLEGFGKFVMNNIIVVLKETARFIREDVVPTVKMFHEAFQTASDLIGPPLKMIGEAVNTFLGGLKTAFQGFYDWLVGSSLWTDMWNQMLTIAGQLISQLLTALGTKLFDPMKKAFTDTTAAVKKTWDDAWTATKTTLEMILPLIQTTLNTKLDEMKNYINTSTGTYGPTMTSALTGMQGAMNAGFALVKGDWQGALDSLKGALTSFGDAAKGIMDVIMGQLQGALNTGVEAMKATFAGLVTAAQGAVAEAQRIFSQVQGTMSNTATQTTNLFGDAYNAISGGATWLYNTLVGHSIWTDLMDQMQAQTYSALGNIAGAFQDMSLGVPATVPYALATPLTSMPAREASAPVVSTSLAGAAGPLSITIPITVTLDGQVITRTVKKMLIEENYYHGRSVGPIA